MADAFQAWGLTRRGHRRENQDRFSLAGLESTDTEETLFREGRLVEAGLGFVVADGVGGSEGGRWAAEQAVSGLGRATYLPNSRPTVMRAIVDASESIRTRAPNAWRPATTAAGVILSRGSAIAFGIGDSRVYGFDERGVTQLTVDHRSGTDARAITRFLGGPQSQSIADTQVLVHSAWRGFLVCTDGFYDHLTNTDLGLFQEVKPAVAIVALMDVALERGSDDNLTALYVTAA